MPCNNDPSSTSQSDAQSTEETPTRTTYCDGDRRNNVWVEGVQDEDGNGGICMLDTMTEAQVVYVLQHDPKAAEDLQRVTTDPELKAWAARIPLLPTGVESDRLQSEVNANARSIPFYSVFQGKAPFAR
jgi:hypothetical protein